MQQYDVVVVGAGPIGSFIAYHCAKEQLRVALIEEHDRIGEPLQCAGLVTERVFDLVNLPEPTTIIQNKIVGASFHSPAGHLLSIGGDTIHALVIDRPQFDQVLASRACDAGADIFLASKVTTAHRTNTGITVEVQQHQQKRKFLSTLLIGADGSQSHIRTLFHFPQPAEILQGIGAEITKTTLDPHFVHILLGHDIAPGFFAWIIPTNNKGTEARIGLCCEKHAKTPLKKCFSNLLHHPLLKDAKLTTYIGGTIPLGALKQTVQPPVMLVGDAAAHVKPTSGGGLYPGLVCAKHCASAAIQALQKTPVDAECLHAYHAAWTHELGRELFVGMQFRKIFRRLTDDQLDTYLQKFNNKKIIDIINEYGDIDYPSKLAFPLIKTMPSLLKFLPSLLRRKH